MNTIPLTPLYKCGCCGWVHFALLPGDILPGTDLERLRRCFNCRAPVSALRPCADADAPKGVTIQGVLIEDTKAVKVQSFDDLIDEMKAVARGERTAPMEAASPSAESFAARMKQ